MTTNLSIIDDDKLRQQLEDIICCCDDCSLNVVDCPCDYPCIFRLTNNKIEEILRNSRVKLTVDGKEVF